MTESEPSEEGVFEDFASDFIRRQAGVDEGATTAGALGRILLATDFSDDSLRALGWAEHLATRLGAEVIVAHAVETLAVVPGSDLAESHRRAAQRGLDEVVARLRGKALTARAMLRAGEPAAEIVAAAAQTGAGLIVMGTCGRTGLAHVLMGSVAERVVRHAACPVLTVPRRAR